MSDQELANAMTVDAEQGIIPQESHSGEENNNLYIAASSCMKVYDYISNNINLITNWKKMNLVDQNGTVLSDTNEVLVGVDGKNIPFSFPCKNLMIPNNIINDVTEIKLFVSGIIIKSAASSIYVSKNNIFVFMKNAEGHTTESYVYYKLRGGKIGYKKNANGSLQMATSEVAKLEFKVSGGRIYNIIEDMTDVNEIRNAILAFLKDKVVDINYCIKIENLCYRCGF